MKFIATNHGYVRVACAVPKVIPGNVAKNAHNILLLMEEANNKCCDLVVFPELALTGYSCGDLFHQEVLLKHVEDKLLELIKASIDYNAVYVIGFPMRFANHLFNAAAVIHNGKLLGIPVKTHLPNYGEFYEQRWFSSAKLAPNGIVFQGAKVPCGQGLVFYDQSNINFTFGVEICEDLWSANPPGVNLALSGANILCNPSASNELVGKAAYRKNLVAQQSGRCVAGYVYTSSGIGESTTDVVYGGHCLIAENGSILKDANRFERGNNLVISEIDTRFIATERRKNRTFSVDSSDLNNSNRLENDLQFKTIYFHMKKRYYDWYKVEDVFYRDINQHPFVPSDANTLRDRCNEILQIQSSGLATRLERTGIQNVVIGISGGLDSTLALIVAIEAFNSLNLDKNGIKCITMPGFGTSGRTFNNAFKMCEAFKLKLETIDIAKACMQHFSDIGQDVNIHDITYENVQARERTQILMDKANMYNALVVGTGDMSELALGWCTYNGDHMSMYAVNAGVPKTLVKFLVGRYADQMRENHDPLCQPPGEPNKYNVYDVLMDVLATPISPELLPTDSDGKIAQKTEKSIGPYELHDFFMYEFLRRGSAPSKIFALAVRAFQGKYDDEEVYKWLVVFIKRFFTQQFKRSCMPDGPKVGTVALSPRGDWRMPSDASSATWITELENFYTENVKNDNSI